MGGGGGAFYEKNFRVRENYSQIWSLSPRKFTFILQSNSFTFLTKKTCSPDPKTSFSPSLLFHHFWKKSAQIPQSSKFSDRLTSAWGVSSVLFTLRTLLVVKFWTQKGGIWKYLKSCEKCNVATKRVGFRKKTQESI